MRVVGIDSSTQSVKVLVVDAFTGAVLRSGRASHPDGTEVHPAAWWAALAEAIDAAGGIDDAAAVSVGGQQHGMVVLDAAGEVIRPALLWNDTRSAAAAGNLISDLGGPEPWARLTGTVPMASMTSTKLRWLADHEPENAARVAAVALPHDWLTWQLASAVGLDTLVTDRSDASGTGYFDPTADGYRRDLLGLALRRDSEDIVLPRVLAPAEAAGETGAGSALGPGCGDNAGAALGQGQVPGDTAVSVGTSGVVAAVSATPVNDASGMVNGFADATGGFLPLAATLNAAQSLDAMATLLGVDHAGLAALALAAEPGAGGLVLLPLFNGERTPRLPDATGTLRGMTLANLTRENLARAAVEGLLGHLAYVLDAVRTLGVPIERVSLVGGAATSPAVRRLAPGILGVEVRIPPAAEYVALGAARQAAWVALGGPMPPEWPRTGSETLGVVEDHGWIRERFAQALTDQMRTEQ
ncbi:MAG: FGGY family carbohydrate kinase [Propioniciclava sp.]